MMLRLCFKEACPKTLKTAARKAIRCLYMDVDKLHATVLPWLRHLLQAMLGGACLHVPICSYYFEGDSPSYARRHITSEYLQASPPPRPQTPCLTAT